MRISDWSSEVCSSDLLPMAVLPPKVRVELVPLTVLLMVVVPLKVNVEPVPLTLPLPGSALSPIVVSLLNVIAEPEPVETQPSLVAVLFYVTVELVPVAPFSVTVAGPLLLVSAAVRQKGRP